MKHVRMINTANFTYAPGSLDAKEEPYFLLIV